MIARLHKQIADAGIPIDGVSGSGASVRIDFRAEATQPQRQQAQQIAAAFDWTPRVPRERSAVLADVQGLSAANFKTLTAHLLTDRILADPYWAIDRGIDIPGDEPEN